MTMSPQANKNRRAERACKWPIASFSPLCRHGNLFVCQHWLGQGDKRARTAIADFSIWPPTVRWLPEHSVDAAFSPSGKLVTNAAEPGQFFYAIRLRQSLADNAFQLLSVPDSSLVSKWGYHS
jgi:hypothetical protein